MTALRLDVDAVRDEVTDRVVVPVAPERTLVAERLDAEETERDGV